MGQLPVFPEETQHAGGVRITTLGLLLLFWLCCVFVPVHGLSSCGSQAQKSMAYGLSCPGTCGVLVLRPGIEPISPALEGRVLGTRSPGKSLGGLL